MHHGHFQNWPPVMPTSPGGIQLMVNDTIKNTPPSSPKLWAKGHRQDNAAPNAAGVMPSSTTNTTGTTTEGANTTNPARQGNRNSFLGRSLAISTGNSKNNTDTTPNKASRGGLPQDTHHSNHTTPPSANASCTFPSPTSSSSYQSSATSLSSKPDLPFRSPSMSNQKFKTDDRPVLHPFAGNVHMTHTPRSMSYSGAIFLTPSYRMSNSATTPSLGSQAQMTPPTDTSLTNNTSGSSNKKDHVHHTPLFTGLRKSQSVGKSSKKGLKSRLRKLRHKPGSGSRETITANAFITSCESDSEAPGRLSFFISTAENPPL